MPIKKTLSDAVRDRINNELKKLLFILEQNISNTTNMNNEITKTNDFDHTQLHPFALMCV